MTGELRARAVEYLELVALELEDQADELGDLEELVGGKVGLESIETSVLFVRIELVGLAGQLRRLRELAGPD